MLGLAKTSTSSEPPYLFVTTTGRDIFCTLTMEMEELNKFLVNHDAGAGYRSREQQRLVGFPADDFSYGKELSAWLDDQASMDWYDHDLDSPLSGLFLPALAYVSLYALLIRAFRLSLLELNPQGAEDINRPARTTADKDESEIDKYAKALSHCTGRRENQILNNHRNRINNLRRFRNAFMHGDWQGALKEQGVMTVKGAFATATELLHSLEALVNEAAGRDDPSGFLDVAAFLAENPSD